MIDRYELVEEWVDGDPTLETPGHKVTSMEKAPHGPYCLWEDVSKALSRVDAKATAKAIPRGAHTARKKAVQDLRALCASWEPSPERDTLEKYIQELDGVEE